MKITKSNIFSFILGLIISGGTVYAVTISAVNVSYDNSNSHLKDVNNNDVTNVNDAIDALYTKANAQGPETYTGSYSYTPSTSVQTVYTANRFLLNNLTINAIPSNYKDVTTSTVSSADDIIKGKKAFLSNGSLVDGNRDECVSDSLTINGKSTTIVNFTPSTFLLSGSQSSGSLITFYYNSNINNTGVYIFRITPTTSNNEFRDFSAMNNAFTLNGSLVFTQSGDAWNNVEVQYIVCR